MLAYRRNGSVYHGRREGIGHIYDLQETASQSIRSQDIVVKLAYEPRTPAIQPTPKINGSRSACPQLTELYELVKSALVGQSAIQNELRELRKQVRSVIARDEQKGRPDVTDLFQQTSSLMESKSLEKSAMRNYERSISLSNRPVLSNISNLSRSIGRQAESNVIQCTTPVIQVQSVKEIHARCHQPSLRQRITNKIDERLRESELGFRDAEHKNAKHQHHHLLNAFDLQRKLREELLGRIYAMQDCKRYK